MATLVIRTVDREHPDPAFHATLPRRGDVIDVLPDGWEFSEIELAHPEWRIVAMPGVPEVQARCLLAGGRSAWEGEVAPHRAFGIDIDHPDLPPAMAGHLASEAGGVHGSDISRDAFLALLTRREPAPHPDVLGVNPHVIG